MVIVSKFGGSSLADAGQIRKVAAILRADSRRKYIVVSAPGKRFAGDVKVTDLLYRCWDAASVQGDFSEPFAALERRFRGIVAELGLELDLDPDFRRLRSRLSQGASRAYVASRGEFLSARILSACLGYPFLDAADCIFFRPDGSFDPRRTYPVLTGKLRLLPRAVIPGFYGSLPDGSIATFSRGGSDITGAIAAAAAGASLYENWTDVPGVLAADPRIVPSPRPVARISCGELRQLSRLGAQVLHEDALLPVRQAGIPIEIRSTDDPAAPGTRISETVSAEARLPVTGIAGQAGFSAFVLTQVPGGPSLVPEAAQAVLDRFGVPLFHCCSEPGRLILAVRSDCLASCRDGLTAELTRALSPAAIVLRQELALLTVTGHGAPALRDCIEQTLQSLGLSPLFLDIRRESLLLALPERGFRVSISHLYHALFP